MSDTHARLPGVNPCVLPECNSEAGLDYGGLMKELLEEVVRRGFSPDFGLFVATEPDGLIYPRPGAERMEQGAQLLEFLGEHAQGAHGVYAGEAEHRPARVAWPHAII